MDKHVTILGTLYIVLSALGVLSGLIIFMVLTGTGYLAKVAEGGADGLLAMGILSTIGLLLLVFVTVLSVPGIVTGIGLLKRQVWARYVGIAMAVLGLFGFPLGTAIGAYALWVLFNDEVVVMFGGKSRSDSTGPDITDNKMEPIV